VQNSLQVVTCTLAANALASMVQGLCPGARRRARLIDFGAIASKPIGVRGACVSLAFVNAIMPARAVTAYNKSAAS